MKSLSSGPFTFCPAPRGATLGGVAHKKWTMFYGSTEIAERHIPASATEAEIIEAFGADRGKFVSAARAEHAPDVLELVEEATGEALAKIETCGLPTGFSGCIPDDRYPYWLMTQARPRRGMPVSLGEFWDLAAQLEAPPRHWICGLLPDEVLDSGPAEWRAPSAWEIRHIVGEGSFTGISGAKAAELVGVTPQNFRKYTAREGASTRQGMGFAMWHLLLHKLGVKKVEVAGEN